MLPNEKISWLKLADANVKRITTQDPRLKNELTRRILLPDNDPQKIKSITDLAPFAGRGVSISDIEQLNGFIQKLPEGKNLADNRRRLVDMAKNQIAKKNPLTQQTDPESEMALSEFHLELQAKEAEMREQKKPVSNLYDPNSPDYFGKQISKYRPTAQQFMQRLSGKVQEQEAAGITPPADAQRVKRPGESAEDFLKRMGMGN